MATNNKNFKVKNGLDVGGNADITGDAAVAGKLSVTASSGDEGGEILLAKPATNTNLVGIGVTVDVYQNKLRFFEQGGDARGYYIDITGGGSAASTNLVGGGSASNSFTTINVPNGTDPSADSSTDTLNLADGANITITGDSSTDTVTVAVDADLTAINGITFDTTPTSPSTAAGTVYWDSGDGVPKAILNANVTIGIGQESILLVKNATGSTLAKGSVVYINGAQGQNPTVALADADTEGTSSKTFGFVAEEILDTAEGYVITEGIIRGVNTDGFTEGNPVYLSDTAGQYTQSAPSEPKHLVFLGYAVKAHATAGEIVVKIQNGYELTELHGVTIEETLADNEVLAYDETSGLWKNQTASEAGLSVTGHTHDDRYYTESEIDTIVSTIDINGGTSSSSSSTIQVRKDTAANWTSGNVVLASGEIGLETDTRLFKIGNGTTYWNDLEYEATRVHMQIDKPTSGAHDGDFWFDTETGSLYIYYDDGTNTQWVEITQSGITGQLSDRLDQAEIDIAALDVAKQDVATRAKALSIEDDFYNASTYFGGGNLVASAISSGTYTTVTGTASHPGIISISDSTTAGGGLRIQTGTSAVVVNGSEKITCSFQMRSARTTNGLYFGLLNNTTYAAPTQGVYFYAVGNGTSATVTGRTTKTSTTSTTASSYTLALNTWVTGEISVDDVANSVTFTIYDASGTVLWTDTLGSTNIPTTATGVGILAGESSTDAAAVICYIDYFKFECSRTLTR